jgi:ATP-dependent Zn protease
LTAPAFDASLSAIASGADHSVAMMPSERKIAAYHEAGHAVVALGLSVTVRRASIRPGRVGYGRVVTHGPPEPADVLLFITLAGPFAHRRFAPRSNWLTSDFAIAEKMISGSKGTAASKEKYLAYIADHAEQIVDYFWADIKVAAKGLLKHETLTGDEISAMIRAARRKSRRRCRIGDPPAFAA